MAEWIKWTFSWSKEEECRSEIGRVLEMGLWGRKALDLRPRRSGGV